MKAQVNASTGVSGVIHDCRFGAQRLDGAQWRFQLWAPDATEVSLRLENRDIPMQRAEDGVFSLIEAAGAGQAYRYVIDGDLAVPDPASRAQITDIDSASMVVDPLAYRWRHAGWLGRPWHEAIVCEVHVGTLGGLDALRERLPHYVAAGFTAIELMPIAEFPGARNWGYDGVLPYAVEASYGSPEALKRLIDAAHGLGLMVFLDVVYNHFGPDGNWLGRYASAFFRSDIKTPWGQAIDFRHKAVRQFFIDNALMWLNEYRFDGLRFDAVQAIEPSAFLTQLSEAIRAGTDGERHIHLILENENNSAALLETAFDAQWNDDAHNTLHALLTGEDEAYYADFADDATTKLATVLSEGFLFQGQNDRRGHSRGEPSGMLSPQAFVMFAQNHDQIGNRPMGERLISLIAGPQMRAVTALVALCPMVPMFFMGDEWGCRTPFLFFTSHRGELADLVREGRRSEFQHFAGFSDAARRARIPDPNAMSTFEASIPRRDDIHQPQAWADWFSQLLAVRQRHIAPKLPGSTALGCSVLGDGALIARWRLGDSSELSIIFNLGPDAVDAPATTSELLFAWPAHAATETKLDSGSLIARLHAGNTR